jgi:hypothetical protein
VNGEEALGREQVSREDMRVDGFDEVEFSDFPKPRFFTESLHFGEKLGLSETELSLEEVLLRVFRGRKSGEKKRFKQLLQTDSQGKKRRPKQATITIEK